MLDFRFPSRGAGGERNGGGSKSQSPGTRCLTFAAPVSVPDFPGFPPAAGGWKSQAPGTRRLTFPTAGGPRKSGEGRNGNRGGESQTPGTRCLTFGTAAGSFETVAGLPGPPGGIPHFPPPSGHREGNRKSSTGYPVLDFSNRRRETEIWERSGPKAGRRKSSTGYPVLDFWNRRRKFRNPCGLARAPGRDPAVSPALGSPRREPKVKHRVPGA